MKRVRILCALVLMGTLSMLTGCGKADIQNKEQLANYFYKSYMDEVDGKTAFSKSDIINGLSYLYGDFNGDGVEDVICYGAGGTTVPINDVQYITIENGKFKQLECEIEAGVFNEQSITYENDKIVQNIKEGGTGVSADCMCIYIHTPKGIYATDEKFELRVEKTKGGYTTKTTGVIEKIDGYDEFYYKSKTIGEDGQVRNELEKKYKLSGTEYKEELIKDNVTVKNDTIGKGNYEYPKPKMSEEEYIKANGSSNGYSEYIESNHNRLLIGLTSEEIQGQLIDYSKQILVLMSNQPSINEDALIDLNMFLGDNETNDKMEILVYGELENVKIQDEDHTITIDKVVNNKIIINGDFEPDETLVVTAKFYLGEGEYEYLKFDLTTTRKQLITR